MERNEAVMSEVPHFRSRAAAGMKQQLSGASAR